MDGYTDNMILPSWSADSFLSGNFQNQYTSWLNSKIQPRGVLTRSYNQIKYTLFGLASDITVFGKNDTVFEKAVIESELGLGDFDCSKQKKQNEIRLFVNQLESCQSKLAKYGKYLYIYIPGSKAEYNSNQIPAKYLRIYESEDTLSIIQYLRDELKNSDLSYYFADEMFDSLQYPAFYKTGTHWSRTYEQLTTNKVIKDLSKLTGKKYRTIGLGNVEKSHIPYWRDSDIWDLLNVWKKPKGIYYQYNTYRMNPPEYDKLKILVKGDSYGEGIQKDILETYPYEDFFYINNVNYISDKHLQATFLDDSWDNLNWQYYLDNIDVVVLEMCKHHLKVYSDGFIEYLNNFLDNYTPSTHYEYMNCFDMSGNATWNVNSMEGIYDKEAGFAWAQPYSELILDDSEMGKGIEIQYTIPKNFLKTINGNIAIYVNGKKTSDLKMYSGEHTFKIEESKIKSSSDGIYDIEIYCDQYINPSEEGWSEDNRNLSLQLNYVGRIR